MCCLSLSLKIKITHDQCRFSSSDLDIGFADMPGEFGRDLRRQLDTFGRCSRIRISRTFEQRDAALIVEARRIEDAVRRSRRALRRAFRKAACDRSFRPPAQRAFRAHALSSRAMP